MKFNKFQIKAQCIRFGLVCCVLFFSLLGWGQTQWGPNALPVIDMSSGETLDELSIALGRKLCYNVVTEEREDTPMYHESTGFLHRVKQHTRVSRMKLPEEETPVTARLPHPIRVISTEKKNKSEFKKRQTD